MTAEYPQKNTAKEAAQSRGRRPLEGQTTSAEASVQTRHDILRAAKSEFIDAGFEGASVNRIAARMNTSKRMLYYYYAGKRELYEAVLEQAYVEMRTAIPETDSAASPMAALRSFAEQSFDSHIAHADTIRLIMIENMNGAQVLKTSPSVASHSAGHVRALEQIWTRGCENGSMREDLRIFDLYSLIVANSFYTISNRNSIKALFAIDFADPAEIGFRRALVGEIACRFASPDLTCR